MRLRDSAFPRRLDAGSGPEKNAVRWSGLGVGFGAVFGGAGVVGARVGVPDAGAMTWPWRSIWTTVEA